MTPSRLRVMPVKDADLRAAAAAYAARATRCRLSIASQLDTALYANPAGVRDGFARPVALGADWAWRHVETLVQRLH